MKKCLILFLSLHYLSSATALANEKPTWFQVEIIVFEHTTPGVSSSEDWQPIASKPPLKNALNLENNHGAKFPGYITVRPRDLKLNKEAQTLNNNPQYKVLLHTAWRQLAYGPHHTKPVHIFGGQLYSSHGNLVSDTDVSSSINPSPDEYWQIDGTMTVNQNHYFDLRTNLVFTKPADQLNQTTKEFKLPFGSSRELKSFQLFQTSRTRSGELNYIDHPLFGVLVKITPIT